MDHFRSLTILLLRLSKITAQYDKLTPRHTDGHYLVLRRYYSEKIRQENAKPGVFGSAFGEVGLLLLAAATSASPADTLINSIDTKIGPLLGIPEHGKSYPLFEIADTSGMIVNNIPYEIIVIQIVCFYYKLIVLTTNDL